MSVSLLLEIHLLYFQTKYSVNVSDSDEKEFDDDSLLQVLRKQRTWVKEQIG